MSNRLDRSLGVKQFNATPVIKPIGPKPKWSLKLRTVVKWLIILCFIATAVHVLHSTNPCTKEVRCAD